MKIPALPLLLLLPALVLAGCPGGKDKKDKDKVVEDTGPRLPPPSVQLVVAGIDPTVAEPETPFDADVLGTGFEKGASVSFSGTPSGSVQWLSANLLRVRVPAMMAGTFDVTVTNPDGTTATLRRGLTLTTTPRHGCSAITVHFELDSAGMFPADLTTLKSAADCWRNESALLHIDGHCDERGTTEYNLALGQRRADAVASYLLSLGIPRSRLRITSYGEERPLMTGHDDSAWTSNRRAEIYQEGG
jgi:outer membrane protein OmpA-like peptidoglycan-associated protein